MTERQLSDLRVLIRGGGDIATGVAWRLHHCGFKILITELPQPLSVRRKVAFCEAVYDGRTVVEEVEASLIADPALARDLWAQGIIPVMVDPRGEAGRVIKPHVVVDAVLAKRNLGTTRHDASLVIALGPGFEAGRDAHYVVETNRGHNLGRLLESGSAEPNTGIPGLVLGHTQDRVLRASADGVWQTDMEIGDHVQEGDLVGTIAGKTVVAGIGGVIRGLIRPGIHVTMGLKIGDIDPRGIREHCFTISEKALAVAGGVLEGIMRHYHYSESKP